jgi:hypothetical protein
MRFPFFLVKRRSENSVVRQGSNRRRNSVISLVAAVLILATITANAFRSKRPIPIAKTFVASSSPQTRTAEALPIQLKAGGFVPREITKPGGDYFFSVQNVSGQEDILLRLESEGGERIHEINLNKQKRSWRKLVHLAPGTYLLTEANNPKWVCRISIVER